MFMPKLEPVSADNWISKRAWPGGTYQGLNGALEK